MRIFAGQIRSTSTLLLRIVAAVVGGYGLASLTSVAALALPIARTEAVLVGMMASFIVYTAAVIWVFAASSPRNAWAGLAGAALPLAAVAATVWLQ